LTTFIDHRHVPRMEVSRACPTERFSLWAFLRA
jgi:hypothetical protein